MPNASSTINFVVELIFALSSIAAAISLFAFIAKARTNKKIEDAGKDVS